MKSYPPQINSPRTRQAYRRAARTMSPPQVRLFDFILGVLHDYDAYLSEHGIQLQQVSTPHRRHASLKSELQTAV